MRYASVTQRLASLGGEKWLMHSRANQLREEGRQVIDLTIGEPDVAVSPDLIQVTVDSLVAGRTAYSDGRGEENLLDALSKRYSSRVGRQITTSQFLCLPGTQTALYAVLQGVAETGDEVLVGDPMYATYEGVIAASGATVVAVPLRAESDFELRADDLESHINERTRAILINTPHNPTGSILSQTALLDICQLAEKHDLWIVSDEVYDELVFDGSEFVSPLSFKQYSDRVIVVSSISKSHAAPGFRSGWCVAPEAFTEKLLPLSETMLFGNQPFIADMTAHGLNTGSKVSEEMKANFLRRTDLIVSKLDSVEGLAISRPKAGMFVLLNVAATGMSGDEFAAGLIESTGVALMPGSSFGSSLVSWVRIALTHDDKKIADACDLIVSYAQSHSQS